MLHAAKPGIVKFQALCRGHRARTEFESKQNRIQRATFIYIALQAQCRGKLAHQKLARKVVERQQILQSSTRFVTKFQAQARKVLVQKTFYSRISELDHHEGSMAGLQALIRGRLARERYNSQLLSLSEDVECIVGLQAQVRGMLARKILLHRVRKLRSVEKEVSNFQSVIRGVLARQAQAKVAQDVAKIEVVRSVGNVQAFARGALTRKRQQQQSKALGFVLPDVLGLQAQTRGFLARKRYWSWYSHLHSSNDEATRLQALLKGAMVRRSLYYRLAHYYHNMDKVVKVQALFRKKQQLDSYRQLMKGSNVPISTIKNFIHLLADNDNDYREEVEVEQLKKTVITKIRANQALEADVSDLDIKIALLVKNKMTLDDIERTRRQNGTLGHKQRNSVLAAAKDPFALASMDKATLRKLELYQQMFYLLQTKPDYLARLFFRLSRIEMGDRARKAVEGVVLTLFGYAQNSREEFLLLKLFQRSIHEEVMGISSLQEFVKGDFVFIKLVVQYGRGTKERKFLQDTLGPMVKEVVEDKELDLETDPLAIYRACIAKEEMEHGLVSQRPIDGVNHQKALEDPEVRTIFIRRKCLPVSDFIKASADSLLYRPSTLASQDRSLPHWHICFYTKNAFWYAVHCPRNLQGAGN
jgi:Ras GTPase-activating-like protein IQGAP2/3